MEDDDLFCPICGNKIEQSSLPEGEYCPFCGTYNDGDADFCCGCGRNLRDEVLYQDEEFDEPVEKEKKKTGFKIGIVLIIVLLAGALIGGGVYGLLSSRGNEEKQSRIESTDEQDNGEDEPDADAVEKEAEEWKVAEEAEKEEKERKAAEEAKKEEEERKAAEEAEKEAEEKKAAEEANSYILPQSATAALTASDIADLSLQELNYARNEIFARHGRKFSSKELQDYFNSKSWYKGTIEPSDFDSNYVDTLSAIEKSNIEVLKKEEYSRSDSGYQLDKN